MFKAYLSECNNIVVHSWSHDWERSTALILKPVAQLLVQTSQHYRRSVQRVMAPFMFGVSTLRLYFGVYQVWPDVLLPLKVHDISQFLMTELL